MEQLNIRNLTVVFLILLAFMMSASVFADSGSYGKYKKPKIKWSEKILKIEVLNGTVVARDVSFTSNRDVEQVTFKVFDKNRNHNYSYDRVKFKDLIEVSQVTPSIEADAETQIVLSFNIPSDTPEGNYKGVVRIFDGKRSIGNPLIIKLKVGGGSAEIVPDGIPLPSPARLVLDEETDRNFILDAAQVLLVEGGTIDELSQYLIGVDGVIEGSIDIIKFVQVRFPSVATGADLDLYIEQINQLVSVESASRITEMQTRLMPNDAEYNVRGDMWNEEVPSGRNAALEFIKAPSAWGFVYGSIEDSSKFADINIGIVDAGFSSFGNVHPDIGFNLGFLELNGRFYSPLDSITDLFSFFEPKSDPEFHGMRVAGIVGAQANNLIGVTGVLWNTNLNLWDSVVNTTISNLAALAAATLNNDIINLSVGKDYPSQNDFGFKTSKLAFERIVKRANDTLFVFAGSNNDVDFNLDMPASLSIDNDNVISVTGIQSKNHPFNPEKTCKSGGLSEEEIANEEITDYSLNRFRGELTRFGIGGRPDIAAPVSVYTTGNKCDGTGYSRSQGTSFSAPLVTGVAGLVLTRNPNLTPAQVKNMILAGACLGGDKLESQGFDEGHDVYALNAFESVKLAADPDSVMDILDADGNCKKDVDPSVNAVTVNNDIDVIVEFDGTGFDATRVSEVSWVETAGTDYLFYAGVPFGNTQDLGLATSNDGGQNWIKASDNPVIPAADKPSWAGQRIVPIRILFEDGLFKLWFWGNSTNLFSNLHNNHGFGFASSTDGLNWIVNADAIRIEVGSSEGARLLEVVKLGSEYLAYYDDLSNGQPTVTYLATSSDGENFNNADQAINFGDDNVLRAATTLSGGNSMLAIWQNRITQTYVATVSSNGIDFETVSELEFPENFQPKDLSIDGQDITFYGNLFQGNVNWNFGNLSAATVTGSIAP